jgi:hypothetical protein
MISNAPSRTTQAQVDRVLAEPDKPPTGDGDRRTGYPEA